MTRVELEREILHAAFEILASRADPDAINAAVARHAAAIERMIRDHYGVREYPRREHVQCDDVILCGPTHDDLLNNTHVIADHATETK